jgi:sec-independent protein translocase protein TatA
MLGNVGPLEIGVVLVVALLVFGPRRLPELGSSLGQGIRGFGKGLKGEEDETPRLKDSVEHGGGEKVD